MTSLRATHPNRFLAVTARAVAGVAIIAALLSGCAHTPAAQTPAAQTAQKAEPAKPALKKGMTTDEVRAAWGDPDSIAAVPSETGKAEVWTYRQLARREQRPTAVAVADAPRVDPFTGQLTTYKEIVWGQESITQFAVIELLVFDGKLTAWRTFGDESREVRR